MSLCHGQVTRINRPLSLAKSLVFIFKSSVDLWLFNDSNFHGSIPIPSFFWKKKSVPSVIIQTDPFSIIHIIHWWISCKFSGYWWLPCFMALKNSFGWFDPNCAPCLMIKSTLLDGEIIYSTIFMVKYSSWLVVYLPLWVKVSWDDYSQYMEK